MDGVYYDATGNFLGVEKGEETVEEWKMRMVKEYQELKGRRERLHKMIVKYDAGTLDFKPNCNIDILRRQEGIMLDYMYLLEFRAEIEQVDLYSGYVEV